MWIEHKGRVTWNNLYSPFNMVDTGYDHVLTDDEYRLSMGQGYVFFEITEPEELAFTYKVLEYSPINQSWKTDMTCYILTKGFWLPSNRHLLHIVPIQGLISTNTFKFMNLVFFWQFLSRIQRIVKYPWI